MNEFPREITSSAIQIIVDKEEQERKFRLETSAANEAQELKKDMQRLELKLNKIMQALRIKDDWTD